MKWRKLGHVFNADGRSSWMASHASNPVAEDRGDGVVRVYFSSRDAHNRAHIGWVELDMSFECPRVVRVADEPVVEPGPLGAFDDSGASMGCLMHQGDRTYLYYLGWNLGVTVPWRNSIGVAVRDGYDAPFIKRSAAPLIDRCEIDPFSLSYPCILQDGALWRMWYGSNLAWGTEQADMHHVIKYAESDDGLSWRREGEIALGLEADGEFAVCRPWVIKDGSRYRMWFCHRGEAYRIGYAESRDARYWQRKPRESVLDVTRDAWDGETLAYPSVIEHGGRLYMFYNGNRYGRTGFGVAVAA